jgi:hypothetical protein
MPMRLDGVLVADVSALPKPFRFAELRIDADWNAENRVETCRNSFSASLTNLLS